MFGTLLGALPTPDGTGSPAAAVELAVRAQEAAGLEPVTDGRLRDPGFADLQRLIADGSVDAAAQWAVEGWRETAALTDRAVKQALPGPYSITRGNGSGADLPAAARALRVVVDALAEAGCPLVEIEESDVERIGGDGDARRRFRDAHRLLVEGVSGTHLSLSIVAGSAVGAGIDTILDAPYASLAVDLINGPDNWNLVTRLPGDRGVIAGVQAGRESINEAKEIMLWAAHYAASTGGRGMARVGLGSAGSWANLTWATAVRKMELLGNAARLAALQPGPELARQLDPRAVNIRTAALGHDAPRPPRRRRR